MIKLFNTRQSALICFILSIGVLIGCTKNDATVDSGKIQLLSFGPTGAKHGDTLRFIGTHLDKVTSIQFTGGTAATVEQKDFKQQTSELILLIVPQAAEKGFVTLKTPDGDIVTKTQLNLNVTTTVTTITGQARPGDNITINGNFLNWVTKVTFARDKVVQTFISKSLNQLVVKVPDDAETGPLILTYGGTDSAELQTKDTLKVTLPIITTMAPNPIDTGANLTVTGTDLDLITSISFVGAANPVTSFVSKSSTKIVVRVPAGVLKGKLTFVIMNSSLTIQSPVDLLISGSLPPLADFPFAIYTDALQNTFQDWSYTDTHDFNSTANVRQGTKSIRAVYGTAGGGYQGVTFHAGTAASTTSYTKLEFSVFGEAGTAGKKLNVVVNGNYSTPPQVTIVGGEWTTYSLLLSSLGSPATINEIVLQAAGWGGVVHIDHVGLR